MSRPPVPSQRGGAAGAGLSGSQAGGLGSSSVLGASRLNQSSVGSGRRGPGAAPPSAGLYDFGTRPQLVDASGRNVTPRPLIPGRDGVSAGGAGRDKKGGLGSGLLALTTGGGSRGRPGGGGGGGAGGGDDESTAGAGKLGEGLANGMTASMASDSGAPGGDGEDGAADGKDASSGTPAAALPGADVEADVDGGGSMGDVGAGAGAGVGGKGGDKSGSASSAPSTRPTTGVTFGAMPRSGSRAGAGGFGIGVYGAGLLPIYTEAELPLLPQAQVRGLGQAPAAASPFTSVAGAGVAALAAAAARGLLTDLPGLAPPPAAPGASGAGAGGYGAGSWHGGPPGTAGSAALGAFAAPIRMPESVLDALVTINLVESDTVTTLDLPATRVLADTNEARRVTADNEHYDALCATIARSGPELYPSRGVATRAPTMLSKDVSTVPPARENAGVQAASYDIEDARAAARMGLPPITNPGGAGGGAGGLGVGGGAGAGAGGGAGTADAGVGGEDAPAAISALESHVGLLVQASLAAPGCLIDADGHVRVVPAGLEDAAPQMGPNGLSGTAAGGFTSGSGAGGRSALGHSSLSGSAGLGASTTGSAKGGKGAASGTAAAGGKGGAAAGGKAGASNNSSGGGSSGAAGGKGGASANPNATAFTGVSLHSSSVASVAGSGSGATGAAGGNGGSGAGSSAQIVGRGLDLSAGAADFSAMDVTAIKAAERVLTSPELLSSLRLVERVLQQDEHHGAHRLYRAGPGAHIIERLLAAGAGPGGHEAAAQALRDADEDEGGGGGAVSFAGAKGGAGGGGGGGGRRARFGRRRVGFGRGDDDDDDDDDGGSRGYSAGGSAPTSAPGSRAASAHGTARVGSADGGESSRRKSGVAIAAGGAGGGSSSPDGAGADGSGGGAGGALIHAPADPVADALRSGPPRLDRLWSYGCPLTEGLNVSSMAWNRAVPDLLAVGYGNEDADGAIANAAAGGGAGGAGGASGAGGGAGGDGSGGDGGGAADGDHGDGDDDGAAGGGLLGGPLHKPNPNSKRARAAAEAASRARGGPPIAAAAAGSTRNGGLIALWSLTNPAFPLAVLRTPEDTPVTAVDFSTLTPALLAAGLSNGRVAVWDVRAVLSGEVDGADGHPAVLSDRLQAGAHTEAVQQVRWVPKPDGTGETLVTVASDGRVTRWDSKKGLAPSLLMTLRRARVGTGTAPSSVATAAAAAAAAEKDAAGVGGEGAGKEKGAATATDEQRRAAAAAALAATIPGASSATAAALAAGAAGADLLGLPPGVAAGEGLLSRTTGGLSFDFVPPDNTQYFVGTEDGLLARCSTSYAEQYLDVLPAHAGPVNRVRISPFLPQALLTCSADWSVKLWATPAIGSASAAAAAAAGTSGGPGSGCLAFTVDSVRDGIADVAWSPAISTVFAAVSRDGHAQVWDATSLTPLIDQLICLDAAEWKRQLAEEAAAEAAARAAAEAAERKRRRQELGYDDDDEDDEALLMAESAANKAKAAAAADEDASDDEKDGTGPGGAGMDGSGAFGDPAAKHKDPPPLVKRLTSVLFAETNGQILLIGDATGRVDVFRICGCDDTLDANAGVSEGNSGGGVDANIVQPGSTVSGDRWMAAQQAAGGEGSQAGSTPAGGAAASLAPAPPPRKPGVMLPVGSAAYLAQERALIALLESLLAPPAPASAAAAAPAAKTT